MQLFKEDKIKYLDIIKIVITIMISIKIVDNYELFFTGVNRIFSIISPFIYAFIIAYVLNPLMSFFERRFKLTRGKSILITYITIVLMLAIFSSYLMPRIITSIMDIIKNIPEFTKVAQNYFDTLIKDERVQNILYSTGNMELKTDFIISKGSSFLASVLNSFLSKTVSFTNYFVKWVFGFIISIYILADKESILETVRKIIYAILGKKNAGKALEFISNLHNMIGVYIGTKAIDSTIIGIMALVGLSIIKSPYSLLIALIVGVTNMIPYFGPFIGMVVAAIINLFFSPIRALVVLIFLFLLQQFDGWYLDPKLIGNKVGLKPFAVIFAVTLGGGLYGPVGMILGVPVMAIIRTYLEKLLLRFNN
ncbi:AI-2E family transporter [uncultured Clostridium sp.]|uniref:AI-2E family transporter n=1 Tax=uncultured Clostridium sp. TaxID=59620 RepID=UPI0028EA713C|nr:AI-2E family transporter [uncultured Clostridium sp.]